MLYIIGLIVVLVLYALLQGDSASRYEEYCNLECIERKIRDHSICC